MKGNISEFHKGLILGLYFRLEPRHRRGFSFGAFYPYLCRKCSKCGEYFANLQGIGIHKSRVGEQRYGFDVK
jgi:hypothetical protein